MAQANVHRCEGCRGLWFEMVDHETLKDRAAELDVGEIEALTGVYQRVIGTVFERLQG